MGTARWFRATTFAAAVIAAGSLAAPPQARAVSEAAIRADGWASQPTSRERDRILEGWAAGATFPELMWILRHDAGALGPVEKILVERALARVPSSKPAIRARLEARQRQVDSRAGRKGGKSGKNQDAAPPFAGNLRASAFRVALLVPGGDYTDFGEALRAGLEQGLAGDPASGADAAKSGAGAASGFPIDVDVWHTGIEDPPRLLGAVDSAVVVDGALVGELLSTPTLLVATAVRSAAIPVISPTATDESIGAIGPHVLAVGPSGRERAARLARALPAPAHRVAVLFSSDASRSFADGFAEAARATGAEIVMQRTYAAGNVSFRVEVAELQKLKADLLFWDGEPREAEALLRQLVKDRVAVRIVGGPALAPDQHHGETTFLLEGVRYVDDEWKPVETQRASLDAASRERRNEPAGSVFVRGWLAGRAIRRAIDGGALVPEELAAALRAQRDPEPWFQEHGFMRPKDVELRVFAVTRGKSVVVGE